jgi:hypothetical protein
MAQMSQLDELKSETSRNLLCDDAAPTYGLMTNLGGKLTEG